MKYLFCIGNKRSGTSFLVRLLNSHPFVGITHESDVLWLLYCFYNNRPFSRAPGDGIRGAKYTLEMTEHLFDRTQKPRESFESVQLFLLENGSPWSEPQDTSQLRVIGDKKPVQMTDKALFSFTTQNFSAATFIHIIRDPVDWLVSYHNLVETPVQSNSELLEFWIKNERRVESLAQLYPVLSFTYEDVCTRTNKLMNIVFQSIGIEGESDELKFTPASFKTYPAKHETAITPEIQDYWLRRKSQLSL